jgi:hypothetical protein
MAHKKLEKLIEAVVEQIKDDINNSKDVQALEELLAFCPPKNLLGYLSEDEWKKFPEIKMK